MILGDAPSDRATRLAGTLAELSQSRLVLLKDGEEVEVLARVTNLPSVIHDEIARTGQARLSAPALGADFVLTRDTGTWECGDAAVAEQLRQRLHK